MAKCPECRSCLEVRYIDNIRYLTCWLCRKWFDVVDNKLVEITEELKRKGLI